MLVLKRYSFRKRNSASKIALDLLHQLHGVHETITKNTALNGHIADFQHVFQIRLYIKEKSLANNKRLKALLNNQYR